jgi:3-deoxy-manno-octulosonate cytidylyltransferase (CMP-KDO synthetase)
MPNDSVIGFIPSRYGSTRLPGKPLQDICGLPMVVRVLQGAQTAKLLSQVMVLTDDRRIYDVVVQNNGEAMMTPESCRNGSERIAWALEKLPCDLAVNIQGDEPLITGDYIDTAVRPLLDNPTIPVGTIACPFQKVSKVSEVSSLKSQVSSLKSKVQSLKSNVNEINKVNEDYGIDEFNNPSMVKVVCDRQGFALYFSRSPIPYPGQQSSVVSCQSSVIGHQSSVIGHRFLKHLGLYVYRSEVLKIMSKAEPTPLELEEKLEQLRFLEMGYRIKVSMVPEGLISVDTQEDLDKVRLVLGRMREE